MSIFLYPGEVLSFRHAELKRSPSPEKVSLSRQKVPDFTDLTKDSVFSPKSPKEAGPMPVVGRHASKTKVKFLDSGTSEDFRSFAASSYNQARRTVDNMPKSDGDCATRRLHA